MAERLASDIARETLKQLAVRRLAPTPENYQTLYEEISGSYTPPPFPEGPLRHILRVMPGQTPAQKRLLDLLEAAIAGRNWSALQSVLVGYANLGLHTVSANSAIELVESPAQAHSMPEELAEQMARVIENALTALNGDDAKVHLMGGQLIHALRQPSPDQHVAVDARQFQPSTGFCHRRPSRHSQHVAQATAHGFSQYRSPERRRQLAARPGRSLDGSDRATSKPAAPRRCAAPAQGRDI